MYINYILKINENSKIFDDIDVVVLLAGLVYLFTKKIQIYL